MVEVETIEDAIKLAQQIADANNFPVYQILLVFRVVMILACRFSGFSGIFGILQY